MVAAAGAAAGAGAGAAGAGKIAGAQALGSGLTSLASGFASLQASRSQARQFKIQGIFLGLQANAEKLKARENANFLRQQFLRNIGSANASFAARGVELGSGIGRRTTIEGLRTLGEDIQAVNLNSEAAQIQLKLSQSQSKLAERTARNTGLLRAGKSFGQGGGSLLTGFSTINTGGSNGK